MTPKVKKRIDGDDLKALIKKHDAGEEHHELHEEDSKERLLKNSQEMDENSKEFMDAFATASLGDKSIAQTMLMTSEPSKNQLSKKKLRKPIKLNSRDKIEGFKGHSSDGGNSNGTLFQ